MRYVIWCIALLVPGGRAVALPTGLVLISTARTVGAGGYELNAFYLNTSHSQPSNYYLLGTEWGFGSRWEAGLDFDLTSDAKSVLVWNAKYIAAGSNKGPALAVGVQNYGRSLHSVAYAVVAVPISKYDAHLGLQHDTSGYHGFVGADWSPNDVWTLMADYTAGAVNASSVGANYEVTDSFGILLGVIVPNRGDGIGLNLQFEFGGKIDRIFGRG